MILREAVRGFLPYFLAEGDDPERNYSWRILWGYVLQADAFLEWVRQGTEAGLPGIGTPTALPKIGRTRRVLRGRAETDESYVDRLTQWLELARDRGKMYGIAREVQHYLGPTSGGEYFEVRCVNRTGTWGILDSSRTWSFLDPGDAAWSWDWDSVSNPERAECDADLWVIVVPPPGSATEADPPFVEVPAWTVSTTSWGHEAPQEQVLAIQGILDDWRAARTRIVATVWAPAVHLGTPVLDPREAGSIKPDGTWGKSGLGANGSRTLARPDWMRFWE